MANFDALTQTYIGLHNLYRGGFFMMEQYTHIKLIEKGFKNVLNAYNQTSELNNVSLSIVLLPLIPLVFFSEKLEFAS